VPESWADAFCAALPEMVEQARGIKRPGPLF
jgi:hypothetical protein